MPELPVKRVEPTVSPLPPLPEHDPLASAQWRTLFALADAVIPSVEPASTADVSTQLAISDNAYSTALSTLKSFDPDDDLVKRYLGEAPSSLPAFRDRFTRIFGFHMPQDVVKQLITVLNLLDSRVGCLLLTGYATPIAAQPVHIREAIVKSWGVARLPMLRGLHKSLTALFKQNWVKSSATISRMLAFPRVPVHGKPGKGFEYEFIQIPPGSDPEVLETDVVIVGSGCGGGVCAKNLAEAGHRVIVVDKAYHWPAEHLPMTETEGFEHLLMHGGGVFSDDSSMAIVAGQAWGGGGRVNWSASLQTQGYVRKEWADQGLPFFTSAEFQHSLDRVCHRMGVSADHVEHNKANRVLLEGARKLGWSAKPVPQNTGGRQHYCGYCTLGCGSCERQGPVVSFLPDAARAGVAFIEGFDVDRVLFDTKDGEKAATGIRGTWTSRDPHGGVSGTPRTKRTLVVKASRVILSAGTMQTPLLLLRSGLKNPHVGRNLKAHPVQLLGAVYAEEVRPWEGGILTAVVNEFENVDGRGHGVKLEACTMLPSAWLAFLCWTGGLEYKLLAPRMRHMTGFISMARDRGAGVVYPDPADGRTRFRYNVAARDRRHIIEGLVALAKINYVAGAREIFTCVPGVSTFKRQDREPSEADDDQGVNEPTFQAWLKEVEKRGLPDPDCTFMAAQQMGTCRMGASPRSSVVDPKGKVWGVERLYVADASVFPSASGVNPMVTNMAIADWISGNLGKELGRKAWEAAARL